MKVLLMLDIESPLLSIPDDVDRADVNEVEQAKDDIEDVKQSIIDGLTSVDMEKAVGACIAGWYLSALDEDVQVSMWDAIEVEKAKDGRRLTEFKVYRRGGIRQTN